MRHFVSLLQSMYPFVQALSMALLAVSLAIVMVTVEVCWFVTTVDRLGISSRSTHHASSRPVAVYRNGEFRGITNDADDDALYELDQNTRLPLTPDVRRDFSVEILDLASTCLKQNSSNICTSGFMRICGVIRRPRTTVLDEYIDSALQPSPRTAVGEIPTKGARGMSVFIDDELGIADMIPASSMDLVTVLQDTRIDSIRKLSADSSDDKDSSEDSKEGAELVGETAALVGEISSGGTQPSDSNEALASAVAFIAYSVYGPGSALTHTMYARHMAHSELVLRLLPFSRTETESLVALL
ncbi:hypothetical protein GGI17_001257 [Coemansia sp. S146]|nr:hypothetical protein GGI17_001257 [Coemansia sp. S146]